MDRWPSFALGGEAWGSDATRQRGDALVLAEGRLADEFPSLEVALAVCVLWLGWRGWVLARGAARLDVEVEALAAALRRGEEPGATGRRRREPAWLGYLARAIYAAARNPEPSAAGQEPVRERTLRIRGRLRSAAARDLVVCAVLLGSLAYARAANLGVSGAFFGLGAVAALLLFLAVGVRLWLDARVWPTSERLTLAVGGVSAQTRAVASRAACPSCGSAELFELAGPRNLGRKLRSLGVQAVTVCTACGHVGGRVVKR